MEQWNFIYKLYKISANFNTLQADMWKLLSENKNDLKAVYSLVPKVSIDYAILEKTEPFTLFQSILIGMI
ncbi:hypothetical protein BS1321_24470 [Peribacillus simplex NBRC 15720 = DSM 1321]|uniref:Uncharacterized protein n=1 Tax=Peribacillus simplex NBRC 15720 = DSM 1321 TaxID=1349754 RepID=A0A223ENK4_9BACI|nr:hypothetical protein BS1321_24470 [Peribacillus simplex NBRC 15720 = DSM 1321]